MAAFTTIPSGAKSTPTPFVVHVPDEDIEHLRTLLRLTKLPPMTYENSSAAANLGIKRDWIQSVRQKWVHEYDWRVHEDYINSFPNFKMTVRDANDIDIGIHFVALFSTREDAIPVVFLHGWPGSFLEFLPLMSLFRDKYSTPDTLPYHLIVPSLPGYAFSDGPPLDKDFNLADASHLIDQLMDKLGFGSNGYIAQGGDVGSGIAGILSAEHRACKAVHVNMMIAGGEHFEDHASLTPEEVSRLERMKEWGANGTAYAVMHKTKPATIGLVLSSSPIALLAWIGEKFVDWVDPSDPLSLDMILTLTTLYWFTDTISRSLYPYRNIAHSGEIPPPPFSKTKPLGYSQYPHELSFLPANASQTDFPNMVRYEHEKGGHFAALEQPASFFSDMEHFIESCRHLFP